MAGRAVPALAVLVFAMALLIGETMFSSMSRALPPSFGIDLGAAGLIVGALSRRCPLSVVSTIGGAVLGLIAMVLLARF